MLLRGLHFFREELYFFESEGFALVVFYHFVDEFAFLGALFFELGRVVPGIHDPLFVSAFGSDRVESPGILQLVDEAKKLKFIFGAVTHFLPIRNFYSHYISKPFQNKTSIIGIMADMVIKSHKQSDAFPEGISEGGSHLAIGVFVFPVL